jgi:peptide/nickel transport system permease protein
MLRYTIRRLLWLPIILIAVSLIAFVLLRTLPGQDPADVILLGPGATEEQKQQVREELNLDEPVFRQYLYWLGDAATGDFGISFVTNRPVRDEFMDKFPLSFQLLVMSTVVTTVLGIGFGILSAIYRNRGPDYGVRGLAVVGASVPSFFLLTLLIVIPSRIWNYAIPVGSNVTFLDDPMRNIRLLGPPALILGIAGASGLMRLTRTTMLEVLRADYVRTARSKGLPSTNVIVGHALRNCTIPILTALGAEFIALFGGSIIAEQVLSIRGIGLWFFQSAFSRDLPVVQFLVVYTATLVIIVNLVVDLSYAFVDPRIRYS